MTGMSPDTPSTIRAELARRRLSQRALAEHLGMSEATLSRRLDGTIPLRLPELDSIAGFLGLSVHELLPASLEGPEVEAAGQ